jgi:hypothetical protein
MHQRTAATRNHVVEEIDGIQRADRDGGSPLVPAGRAGQWFLAQDRRVR